MTGPGFKDISGQRFGMLVAVSYIPGNRSKLGGWLCRCDCGSEKIVNASSLKTGNTNSCGCGRRKPAVNRSVICGEVFKKLTVVGIDASHPGKTLYWLCKCECGGYASTTASRLKSGHTTSCGCVHRKNLSQATHYLSDHPLYNTWAKMIRRCYSDSEKAFPKYGGRGIAVCDRWRFGEGSLTAFECFLSDMGEKPYPDFSIERHDNDGNYQNDNCYWADKTQQAQNRKTSRFLFVDGERISAREASKKYGIPYAAIIARLNKLKMSDEAAVKTPIRRWK